MQNEFEKKHANDIANNTEEVTKEVTEKTTLDMARKMKKQGINMSDIAIITGLSKDTIDTL